jgi:hypothetical protein
MLLAVSLFRRGERPGQHDATRGAGETHVRDTQRGKVVALAKLAAHALARTGSTRAQGRGHVAALLAGTGAADRGLVAHAGGHVGGAALGADGGHGVLVGTAGREMLAVTDTTLDGLVLELVLHGVGGGVLGLVLGVLLPVGRQAEDDVLADRRRVALRARLVVGRQAELGPRLALGHARVDHLAVRHQANAPRRLHLLAVLIVAVRDARLGAVLVLDRLGGRQLGRGGLVELVVVGPVSVVLSAIVCPVLPCLRVRAEIYRGLGAAAYLLFDMLGGGFCVSVQ